MTTKVCYRCHVEQPADSEHFGSKKASKDGLYPTCKKCLHEDHRKRARSKKRPPLEQRRQYQRERLRKNPEILVAYHAVEHALKDGLLLRPDGCENCGRACVPEAHHEDYFKPLEVNWLCKACHALADKNRKERPVLSDSTQGSQEV